MIWRLLLVLAGYFLAFSVGLVIGDKHGRIKEYKRQWRELAEKEKK